MNVVENAINIFRNRRLAVVAGTLFAILVLLSIVFPLFWPFAANEQNLSLRLHPPVLFGGSWTHPFGTDHLGRDILSRIAAGARVSLAVSGLGVALSAATGAVLGVIGGFYRGKLDAVVLGLTELQLSFPGLLMAILLLALLGPSPWTLVVFLWYQGWPVFARTVRGKTISLRERSYVEAAYAVGAGDLAVMTRHISPNLLTTVGVIGALELAYNMLIESGLSFLGLGVQPPDVSWGLMLAAGREYMSVAWWTIVFPGLAIVFAVLTVMTIVESSRGDISDVGL